MTLILFVKILPLICISEIAWTLWRRIWYQYWRYASKMKIIWCWVKRWTVGLPKIYGVSFPKLQIVDWPKTWRSDHLLSRSCVDETGGVVGYALFFWLDYILRSFEAFNLQKKIKQHNNVPAYFSWPKKTQVFLDFRGELKCWCFFARQYTF